MKHEEQEKRVGKNAEEQDGQNAIERCGEERQPNRRRFLKSGAALAVAGAVPYASPTVAQVASKAGCSPAIWLENTSLANAEAVDALWEQAIIDDNIEPGSQLDQICTFYADSLFIDDGMGNPIVHPDFASLLQQMQDPYFDYLAWANSFEQPTPEDPDNLVFPPELLALEDAVVGSNGVPLNAGIPALGEDVLLCAGGKTKEELLAEEQDRHDEVMELLSAGRAICDAACLAIGGGIALLTFGIGVAAGVLCLAACETSYAKAATNEKRAHRRNKRKIREDC